MLWEKFKRKNLRKIYGLRLTLRLERASRGDHNNHAQSEYTHVLADISRSPLLLCAPSANPPNVGGTPYHSSKLHPGPCSSVGMRPRTDRQTDARDHYLSRRLRFTRNVTKERKRMSNTIRCESAHSVR